VKAALQRILDLLEAGDVRGAELALLDLLDEVEPGSALRACAPLHNNRCEDCGRTFKWPGLLEAHRFSCVAAWRKAS
jgi:hypothetical protein